MTRQFNITITNSFIQRRNERMNLFAPNNRTEIQRLLNADCELLEWYLCQDSNSQHIDANRPQFDTFHPEYGRCEFKNAANNSITIKPFCAKQSFDTFIVWKFTTPHHQPLQEGDKVQCEIIEITNKSDMMQRARPSKFNKNDLYIMV